uniref:DUF38 domain-containing protein n=1 Tax=Acrobeloides nanus TaxID=290746 RepID=A0A914CFQ2_9BILA
MASKVQLDRDIISGIFKHNLAQQRDVLNFKFGLVSKKCFLALKTACDVECKGAKLSFYEVLRFFSTRDLDLNEFHEISEPEFWLLKKWSLCELEFGDDNDQRYLQLLRKIKGFGLKRIFLNNFSDYNSSPDLRSEILRIISESSGTLKELCDVPDIFLPHLPHTLKLEKLTTSLRSIPMNRKLLRDFLKLSAKEVRIDANDCYLPSHLLKNINAQTLHVRADKSWAEGIEESSVEIQANPSIQEISIFLRNGNNNPNKIYDIKKIIESIQKGYPNLTLLEIEDIYDSGYNVQFVTELFMKTEAILSELQDLSFSIHMKQAFVASHTRKYCDFIYEISRRKEWKDFEKVKEYPQEDRGQTYLSLKKSTQFGEGKSLEVTFYTSAMTKETNSDYDSYDD